MVSKATRNAFRASNNIERCLMLLIQRKQLLLVQQLTGMSSLQVDHYLSRGVATDTQLGFLHAIFGDVRNMLHLDSKLRGDRCSYCWGTKQDSTDATCNKCQRLNVRIYVSRSVGKSTTPPIHIILMQKIHLLVDRGKTFGSVSHGGWSATFDLKKKE